MTALDRTEGDTRAEITRPARHGFSVVAATQVIPGETIPGHTRADMDEPHYPAARIHAARLEDHFARHLAGAAPGAPPRGPASDAAAIEALVDAGFRASLQREEGFTLLAWSPGENPVHAQRVETLLL